MQSRNDDTAYFSIFFYDISLCLSLIMTFYHLYHHYQSKKIKRQHANVISDVKLSFLEAKNIYLDENRVPWTKSKLGGRFGLFSAFLHSRNPPIIQEMEAKLSEHKNNDDNYKIINYVTSTLKEEGSLWDPSKGYSHSFNNYFLTCLRYTNIHSYRYIVGNNYGIKFISDAITLYRRDTRMVDVIFKEGFQLKESWNKFSERKMNYVNPITLSYGVSFAKKIPPNHYGNSSFYYVVELPPNHDFLIVDIANNPCNSNKLGWYQRRLEEVNSLDDVPPAFVKSCVTEKGTFRLSFFSEIKYNKNYAPVTKIPRESRSFHGCY